MRRRRRIVTATAVTAAAVGPKGKMSRALKQHILPDLKHWIRKSARSKRRRKASEVVTKSGEETTYDFLPFHVMADHILSRLPVKSLARFRSVCKQWCSLTYNPCFAKGQLERASATESFTFMSTSSYNSNKFWIYDFVKLNNGGKTIKERTFTLKFGKSGSHILSNSIDGLFCAVYEEGPESERSCALFNPTTQEVLMLPKRRYALDLPNITREPPALGFGASSGEYKLVCTRYIYSQRNGYPFNYGKLSSCVFEVLTVGTQEWRYVAEIPCRILQAEVVYLNGALHWLTENLESQCPIILVFDVKNEKLRFISIPKCKLYVHHIYLRKLEGRICIVKERRICIVKEPMYRRRSAYLEIWRLEDYANEGWKLDANEGWKLEYNVDISGLKDPHGARVVDIISGKVLVQNCGSLYSNVMHQRIWHKLIDLGDDEDDEDDEDTGDDEDDEDTGDDEDDEDTGLLYGLTESLISPSNLPVV